MQTFLGSLFWFIVVGGVVVLVHELGHFWVARRCGVRVLRFSLGLGPPIWSLKGRGGTEFVIGAVPLGGYVRMLDERADEVPAAERELAFNRKPVGHRAAVMAAGPLFNFAFALVAFWVMLLAGVRDYAPYVGEATGLGAEAGIRQGDRISAVEGRPVDNWTHVLIELTTGAYRGASVAVELERADGARVVRHLALGDLKDRVDEERLLEQIGLVPWHRVPPAVIGRVLEGDPAARAGLRPGDRVLRVGDREVSGFAAMIEAMQSEAAAREGRVRLLIERDGKRSPVDVLPRKVRRGNQESWYLGAAPDLRETLRRSGPLQAVPGAITESWRLAEGTLEVLWHLLAGDASPKIVQGPIGIAQIANASAQSSLGDFMQLLALVSLGLGILNLLPLPFLDGGRLLYLAIEWIKGSPLSERAEILGLWLSLGALLAFFGLALFNDLSRLIE